MHRTSVETTVSIGRVGEWQLLGGGVDHPRLALAAAHRLLEALAHRRVGLCEHEAVEVVRVVGEIQAGAAADLQRPSARLGQEVVAVAAHAGALADPQGRVIDRRRTRVPTGASR